MANNNAEKFIDYIPLFVFFSVWAMDERTITLANYQHSVGGIFMRQSFYCNSCWSTVACFGTAKTGQISVDTLAAVVLFTIPTIIFRDTNFLKWKAPIVNWIFALIFMLSRYLGEKPAIGT